MSVSWAEPAWFWALAAGPALWLLIAWGQRARRRAAARLVDPGLHELVGAAIAGPARKFHAPAIALAGCLLALSLARPQWDPRPREVSRQGRDVVFAIDVSRSMLARDLAPSRLDRTKIWVQDLVHSLDGDRVGLVAFAGAAVVKCPLTHDYSFFRLALDELSPASVPRGGTNLGDAIRKVLSDVFQSDPASPNAYRDIVLITDGEDQESLPVEAAAAAAKAGVRIIALGVGSDQVGAAVPVEGPQGQERSLTYAGQTVESRQDSQGLAQIAAASAGGVYLNVGTGTIELDRVYRDLVRSAAQTTTSSTQATIYQEGFQWLLLPALLVLVAEALLREHPRRQAGGRSTRPDSTRPDLPDAARSRGPQAMQETAR